ncbi:MAG: RnfH family protein [Thiotrichales bacterium]
MQISVAYAEPAQQVWLRIEVPEQATVAEAIERSGILCACPGIDLETQKIGVFGKLTQLDARLQPGDRIEIYRPLIADPKAVPRRRLGDEDDDDD